MFQPFKLEPADAETRKSALLKLTSKSAVCDPVQAEKKMDVVCDSDCYCIIDARHSWNGCRCDLVVGGPNSS